MSYVDEEVDDVVTSSISKGCFLFKPSNAPPSPRKGASPRKRKKKDASCNEKSLKSIDFFSTFPNETKTQRTLRYDHFTKCWEKLYTRIQEVQNTLNSKIFIELLNFMEKSKLREFSNNSLVSEIPTAVLVTGVNLPDHGVVFQQLVEELNEAITPFTVKLQSKECSNLKFMLKNAFDALYKTTISSTLGNQSNLKNNSDFSDEDSDDELYTHRRVKTGFSEYTFQELKKWYFDYLEKNEMDGCLPIIFILEDFERFVPSVLQDFIYICSEHGKDIPMVFVFGVATTVSTVHSMLSHSATSRLSIEKFQSQPSLVCLTEVVDQVLITESNAFKLGPKVFRLLYEHFLYHDFSVKNFIRALKFCVMEHFNNSPLSVFCVKDKEFVCSHINKLELADLAEFKSLKSIASFLDKKSKNEQTKLNTNVKYFKEVLLKQVTELYKHEDRFYPMVKCLSVFSSKLPGLPLGKRLRDTYEFCVISPKITKDNRYEECISLIRLLSRIDLEEALEECKKILRETIESCGDLEEVMGTIESFSPKFIELDHSIEDIKIATKSSPHPSTPSSSSNTGGKKTVYKNRHDFQEQLRMAVKEKRKQSPYEKLRTEIVDFLDSTFKKYLFSPMYLQLSEIYYYNDIDTVRVKMNGTPRAAIQKALSDPNAYLECTCCKGMGSNDVISDCQPDICILYKLHTECGKLINLYDWLQAFTTVVDPSLVSDASSKKKKSKAKQQKEDQLQARFIRGVSELQFLGFIKSTKRKTDHVARLTWGTC